MGKQVHYFSGWQGVTRSSMWHYFMGGVSLCGRYTEIAISRVDDRARERKSCVNCERSRSRRKVGGQLPL